MVFGLAEDTSKKLLEAAAPNVLAKVIKELIVALSPDPTRTLQQLLQLLPVRLPQPVIIPPLRPEDLAERVAKSIASNVDPKRALQALVRVHRVLDEYGIPSS